ncbi:hypothetical protein [Paenibacillus methanolicus]|uniref:Uncharacterized protein n=1 Tax=Paenibacillus methanolicus TaxID=582686 RepID=A0A5S5C5W7_9BACL|nr:hypothetical protein [Paenibacillus methanolicus]TYP74734.1 hypothetical protein BCM02_105279 [Paenibacillus methanolicus]
MLKDALTRHAELAEDIQSYMMNYRNKTVTSAIFFAFKEYENYMQIYRTSKSQYSGRLEAFVTMWTNALVDDQEWHHYYEPTLEFAHNLYRYWFIEQIEGYTYELRPPALLVTYAENSIRRKTELILEYRKRNPLEELDVRYPSATPGFYLNGRLIDDDRIVFPLPHNLLSAEELKDDPSWAGYKEIFFETEYEYIYFAE